jgi:hypothetical protein
VDYSLGGINYLSGNSSPRGVYVYVTPVELKSYGPGLPQMESCILFEGLKHLLMPLNRKSDKKIEEANTIVKSSLETKSGYVYEIVKTVAERKGLII